MKNNPKNDHGETPLQEIERMKKIENHFKKLSPESRDFVLYVQKKRHRELLCNGK